MRSTQKTGALALVGSLVMLAHLACSGPGVLPATPVPEKTPPPATSDVTVITSPTPPQAETGPSPTPAQAAVVLSPLSTPAKVVPPVQPLRAWTVADDGTVYVLDASHNLFQLTLDGLSPLAISPPLFDDPHDAPAFLLAGETHLFVGSRASGQTLVLSRSDFSQVDTLDRAGPMALDAVGQRLFLVPEFVLEIEAAFTGLFLAYSLSDLSRLPLEIELSCLLPQDSVVDAPARQLYVRTLGMCASPPHQREAYTIYDLTTLTEVGASEPQLGTLTRPVVAEQAGLLVTVLHAKSGFLAANKLTILDQQGQELKARPALDGIPATDADGEWLYLLRQRGLWVLRGSDLSLRSILPFTETPPADLAISPAGDLLYLFGNGWLSARPTADLQALGVPSLSPFPPAWSRPNPNIPSVWPVRLYRSPQMAQDGIALAQVGLYGGYLNSTEETYRTTDGGQSWQLLLPLLEPGFSNVQYLSLSPEFADDQTLVAQAGATLIRSTDGGDTWSEWTAPIAFVSERDGNRELYLMSQSGDEWQRLTDSPAAEENPAWSPAWTRLAFQSDRDGNWDVFTLRSDCAPSRQEEIGRECSVEQLTTDPADDLLPAWSPDGRSIAFVSLRDGNPEIYLMASDGQNQRRLTFNPTGDWRPAWLPDSRHLVFTSDRSGNNDIYRLAVPPPDGGPLISEPELIPLITGPADDRDPALSADGQLFFLSDRDGFMRTYRLDLKDKFGRPYPASEATQPEGHPSPVGTSPYTVLVAVARNGTSTIYRVIGSEYTSLTSGSTFDGQPAWGPVLWNSVTPMPKDGLVK